MEMANRTTICIKEAALKLGITLKDKQLEAVLSFMRGKDVFVSLPTGYGKSIIYTVLPLAFDLYKGKHQTIVCMFYISVLV